MGMELHGGVMYSIYYTVRYVTKTRQSLGLGYTGRGENRVLASHFDANVTELGFTPVSLNFNAISTPVYAHF